MKIYLYFNEKGWNLVDSEKEKHFDKLLKERDIMICDLAKIGDGAKIGNRAEIGYKAEIGNEAEIGDWAKIGDEAEIGNWVEIGNWAEIGNGVEIGDWAEIGNGAEIGDGAEIGNRVEIGNEAEIPENFNQNNKDVFTPLYIQIMTGVIMVDGVGTFYKAVNPDLTDFQTGKYKYKIGKGDENKKLKRNQEMDCGEGWHWTSYDKAVAFAEKRPHKIISAQINLKDILSVYTKMRVKKFSKVREVNLLKIKEPIK